MVWGVSVTVKATISIVMRLLGLGKPVWYPSPGILPTLFAQIPARNSAVKLWAKPQTGPGLDQDIPQVCSYLLKPFP